MKLFHSFYLKNFHEVALGGKSKTIDKLTKKLLQYEDYDHPTHSLAEMGSSEDGKASSGDSVDNLFESRDRVAANRR